MSEVPQPPLKRRLAAILAADVAGYSRLMGLDEVGTLTRLNALRRDSVEPKIAQFHGTIVGSAGDSLLVEFASALDAVQCAVEVQERLAERNSQLATEQRMEFRMGINLGDVIAEQNTIFGDGVNIAARLEKLSEPGGVIVARSVFEQVKGKLPYAFADLGDQRFKNISEPIRAYRVGDAVKSPESATPIPSEELPLPSKPSVAVLPFTNMSGDKEQEYFSDGITEDIITELSRNPTLFVIARNSSFVFKGTAVDVSEVGRKLGVRYVVEGSVRKAGPRVRITSQLIEAVTGAHVWAERYDRDLADLFAIQDEVTEQIVWALVGRVGIAEIEQSKQKKHEKLDSYDLLLRGIEALHRFAQKDNAAAVRFFERAVEADPLSARARAWLAEAYGYAATFEANPSRRAQSNNAARQAIDLGDISGHAEAILAGNSRWRGDFDSANAHLERALALGPNNPSVLAWAGFFRLWQGRTLEARDIGERLRRLDPFDPGWVHELLGCAYYLIGEYKLSLESFHRWRTNDHYRAIANMAACLAQLGRVQEARAAWSRCLELKPGFTIEEYKQGSPYLKNQDLERWLDGLSKLGLQ